MRKRIVVPLLAQNNSASSAGNRAAGAVDDQRPAGVARFDLDAQPAEAVDHHPRVFAIERAGERRNAVRQRRADQRPIRNALRPRRPHAGPNRPCTRVEFQAIQTSEMASSLQRAGALGYDQHRAATGNRDSRMLCPNLT